ncbi:MAG: hypothetical protein VX910_08295 [Candidatus Latescibacterota bacterium]|nr:hypothetical protein [Candidatus Latescibacterota bacterium]
MTQLTSTLAKSALLLLMLTGCDRDESSPHSEATSEETPSNRVEIPATVRNNLGITFAKVERRKLASTIRLPGTFELQPLARHEYRIILPGVIEYAVDHLSSVEPGTILYKFRSAKWLELQARIQLTKAALDQAISKLHAAESRVNALKQADFKRADLEEQVANLRADVAKSEADLLEATNHAARTLNLCSASEYKLTADDLLASVERNGTTLPFYETIEEIQVHAKEPGIVETLAVTDGVFAEETTLVITTVNPDMLRFRALGLQSDLHKFETGAEVRIVQPQSEETNINEAINAVLKVGLEADPDRRTITLFANPTESSPWIRPGVSAFMEIAIDSSSGFVLAIPRSAVVKDGITHIFFKRDPRDPNKAIRVEADLGVQDGRWIEVKSEIGPSDEVIMNGAYELKLATTGSGTTQKGGHFHTDGTFHGDH